MSSSPWFWRFNPRFYRGTRPNTFTKYLYWIFGYEILAMGLLGLYIWWAVIPMAKLAVERRNREIERGQRERLGLSTESLSPPETSPNNTFGITSQLSSPPSHAPGTGETPKEIR